MAGSKVAAIMFVIAATCMIVQTIVSIAIFDDGIGALAGGVFTFVMFVGAAFAYTGGLAAVQRVIASQDTPMGRIDTYEDTGERVQCTPCFGVCSGIAAITIATMFAEFLVEDIGDLGWVAVSPAIIGGIFAILSAVVFVAEYKGPYVSHA